MKIPFLPKSVLEIREHLFLAYGLAYNKRFSSLGHMCEVPMQREYPLILSLAWSNLLWFPKRGRGTTKLCRPTLPYSGTFYKFNTTFIGKLTKKTNPFISVFFVFDM